MKDMKNEKEAKKALIKIILLSFVSLLLVITFFWTLEIVDAGTVKVVKRFGALIGSDLQPGLHLIVPWIDTTEQVRTRKLIYETTTEEKQKGSNADYKDFPVDTNTKDGQQVDVYYTVRFSIDPTKASWVIQNFGSEDALVEKVVKTESRIWTRNIPREFDAASLYSGSVTNIQNQIEEKLRGVYQSNGIILDSVGIRELKFSEQYVSAIEAKQIEAVKVDTAKQIAARAEFEKLAAITQAEARSQAQKLESVTLSSQYLQGEWIKKWNGQLPVYMTGDAQNLIQLPK
mgnify:CR=1 FL=1